MASDLDILELIPHRPPFLWVDRIVELGACAIVAEKLFAPDLDLYQGHYPHHPITPGVILCEAIFQAGAILISQLLRDEGQASNGIPVLTRIYNAKFKRQVPPGTLVRLEARLVERVGPAWMMKGKALINGKSAVSVDFACAEAAE